MYSTRSVAVVEVQLLAYRRSVGATMSSVIVSAKSSQCLVSSRAQIPVFDLLDRFDVG